MTGDEDRVEGADPQRTIWAAAVITDGRSASRVRFTADERGRIASIEYGVDPGENDLRVGTVAPGMGNAHSHAFHRLLRGRTHDHGGDFWKWRDAMYAAAATLDPDHYGRIARAVFGEMLVCGWTAVGEFHYVHHRSDGTPYSSPHAMELAIAGAAVEVGIRLALLDTAYLASGLGAPGGPSAPLRAEQLAFGDGNATAWLERWHGLRTALSTQYGGSGLVTLGAALHSVRAVPADAMRTILEGLPDDVPLHVHLSEQPQENLDTILKTGQTPTGLLDGLGALDRRISLVHATHLTEADITAIGRSGATVVMCPTTEADLGDGIGPARQLADSGAHIAIGSDQNAVIDPLLELRGLEAGERLSTGLRGRFTPEALLTIGSANGYRSLGLGRHGLAAGDPLDLVELDTTSLRTTGTDPAQIALVATAADVERVIVGGTLVAQNGRLLAEESPPVAPGRLLATAIDRLQTTPPVPSASSCPKPARTTSGGLP